MELDVHRSADGALVVFHDAAIDGFGVLAEQPFTRIREEFSWIPTLGDVLDECVGMVVNIEIKNSPPDADFDAGEWVAGAVVELLHDRGRADDVLVSSFHFPTIERVHALDPTVPTGFLAGFQRPVTDAIAAAAAGGHGAVHPFFGMLADAGATTVVEAAHASGLAVNTWTVNEPDEIARLAAAGVDAIITDVPAAARAAIG